MKVKSTVMSSYMRGAFTIAQGWADVAEPQKKRFFVAESSNKAKKSAGASLATSDSTQRNKGDNGSMMARLERREHF